MSLELTPAEASIICLVSRFLVASRTDPKLRQKILETVEERPQVRLTTKKICRFLLGESVKLQRPALEYALKVIQAAEKLHEQAQQRRKDKLSRLRREARSLGYDLVAITYGHENRPA